jgi:RHS repeat-associated protein
VEVYFDDFKVEHVKGPVIQSQSYYPFGLTFSSYQRENSLANQHQYNGKELQDELSIGWLDFGTRMYNSEIARWNNIDPLADKYVAMGSYVYVANNPLIYVDPGGEEIVLASNSTSEFKQSTLTNLQKLTNAELELVDNVIRIKENGTPQNANHDLKVGTEVIGNLVGSKQIVTMTEGDENSTYSSYSDTGDGTSKPTGSKVVINLNDDDDVVRQDGSKSVGPLWETYAHELIHAYLRANGKQDPDYDEDVVDPDNVKRDKNGTVVDDGKGYVDKEEVNVRKKTNEIVNEQYGGKAPKSALRKEPYKAN